jgi:hypothetical protein
MWKWWKQRLLNDRFALPGEGGDWPLKSDIAKLCYGINRFFESGSDGTIVLPSCYVETTKL